MHNKFLFWTLFLSILIPSCGTRNSNISKSFLNYNYKLKTIGDLHGLSPTSNEVLDRNPGFTDYSYLFNKEESYINFVCKGTSFDDFYCEGSFKVLDSNNNTIVDIVRFYCSYTGDQWGEILFDDVIDKDTIGKIYVYTPYWCRWQIEYDIDKNGNMTLLTFEFWKDKYNDLPEFLKYES